MGYYDRVYSAICAYCGKKIAVTKQQKKSGKPIFCCMSHRYEINRTTVKCELCGKEKRVSPCVLKRSKIFFCSVGHKKHYQKHISSENTITISQGETDVYMCFVKNKYPNMSELSRLSGRDVEYCKHAITKVLMVLKNSKQNEKRNALADRIVAPYRNIYSDECLFITRNTNNEKEEQPGFLGDLSKTKNQFILDTNNH